MNQRITRSLRERRPIRIRRGTAGLASAAVLVAMTIAGAPAEAGPSQDEINSSQINSSRTPNLDRLRQLSKKLAKIKQDFAELCSAVKAGDVTLPDGFDPCASRGAGLPDLSAGGSGGSPGEIGRAKGCEKQLNKLQQRQGWSSEGIVYEDHSTTCNKDRCVSNDSTNNIETGEFHVRWVQTRPGGATTTLTIDGNWQTGEVHTVYETFAGGRQVLKIDETRHQDGTVERDTTRYNSPDPHGPRTTTIESRRQDPGEMYLEAFIGGRGFQIWRDHEPEPPRRRGRGTRIPPVGEDPTGPTLDEMLDLAACQLDKQERYVDGMLRKYGASLDDIPDEADVKQCQRPDEDTGKAEESASGSDLPCPGETEPEGGTGPLDPVEGDKGDGDGLHPGRGPDVEDIGPIPVPEALERIPCGGPDVDCAEVAAGALSGILPVAGAVLGWDTGKRLVSRLWPW